MSRYSVEPEPAYEIEIIDDLGEVNNIRMMMVFGERWIKPLFVIVEVMDHSIVGRRKREYLAAFAEAERKTISRVKTSLRRWYLVTGIPTRGVSMKLSTMRLMQRAASFMASL